MMMLKKYLFITMVVFCNTMAFAQQRSNPISKAIVQQYNTADWVYVFKYSTDTLFSPNYAKPINYKPMPDQQSRLNYYDSKGNMKCYKSMGGIMGNYVPKQFKQIFDSMVLIGVLYPKLDSFKYENKLPQNKPTKTFNPNGNEILLYDQPNYQGHQLIINAEGDFDLTTRTGWNNTISSIQVPNGYFLTLYDLNPYNKTEGNIAEIGNKKFAAFQIPDFKKLPASYFHTPATPDYEVKSKTTIINFDKKVSFITIIKSGK